MSHKPILLIAASLAVVGSLWIARPGESSTEESAMLASFSEQTNVAPFSVIQLDELNRLVGEFTDRHDSYGGVTNGTTLGRLYLQRAKLTGTIDDYVAARNVLANTLADAPQSIDTKLFLAYAVNDLHMFSQASALAYQIDNVEPGRLDVLALIGDTALSLGDYDTARESFEELYATVPGTPEVLVRYAQISRLDGDSTATLARASEAIAVAESSGRPAREQALYLAAHGALATELGQPGIAIGSFDAALFLVPEFPAAVEGRGVARALIGDLPGAIADLEVMTSVLPDLHAHIIFGDILTLAGEIERAAEQYEIARALSDEDEFGLFVRQVAAYELDHEGDYMLAARIANDELEGRQDRGAYDLAAWAAYRLGDLDRARTLSDVGLSLAAPSGLALYHAGAISAALGDIDGAISRLEQALAANPYFDLLAVGRARELLTELRAS